MHQHNFDSNHTSYSILAWTQFDIIRNEHIFCNFLSSGGGAPAQFYVTISDRVYRRRHAALAVNDDVSQVNPWPNGLRLLQMSLLHIMTNIFQI